MTIQEYNDAVEWLFRQAPNYQIDGQKAYKPGLQNITALCEFFGNPQDSLKMIHIGGTNGKGSTSNMLASILQEAGYKVGLYNSPHLIDFTERIKVNGENCYKEFVFGFIEKLKQLPESIKPSFFEFTTIMGFEYFKQQEVDFAIIEVGLGGRLDSTNIINPLLTAITNVDLDHMNILGSTKEEIAVEKAGIIKSNVPIISGEESPEIKKVFQNRAKELNAQFIDATQLVSNYSSDLKGNYQAKNRRVVEALIIELQKLDAKISQQNLMDGFSNVHKNTGFIGRWFIQSENPLTICDTAHNQAGLELVFEQLNSIDKHKHIVLGFVDDKKIDEVLTILPVNATYYFVKPTVARGRNPETYEDLLRASKIKYTLFQSVWEGYLSAKQNVRNDDLIFVGGSNFVVGDFLEKSLQE